MTISLYQINLGTLSPSKHGVRNLMRHDPDPAPLLTKHDLTDFPTDCVALLAQRLQLGPSSAASLRATTTPVLAKPRLIGFDVLPHLFEGSEDLDCEVERAAVAFVGVDAKLDEWAGSHGDDYLPQQATVSTKSVNK